jgi:hypothetical protein
VTAVNHLVAFYDIHGRRGEVLFFCSVPDATRDLITINKKYLTQKFKIKYHS